MQCLQCHQPIRAGRADRKFCSDGCKNAFHNAERLLENDETSRILLALRQNRRILKGLVGDRDEVFVSRSTLADRGFNFVYHTHRTISGQGNVFYLCFNYGYRQLEPDRLKLVKWKRE